VFDEINSVENFVRDLLSGPEMGWFQIDGKDLPRSHDEVFLEEHLRNALIRLNPAIAEDASRADEVLYKLRAILLSVRSEGLVRANERFAAWLVGEHSMPFGPDGEHVTVRLIDIEDFSQNDYLVSTQVVYKPQPDVEVRYDLVLWVNGMPLVVGEAKTATRPAISWVDGAIQVHDRYEVDTPMFFAPNVFSFATEGKTFRYGSVRMPVEKWGPWRATDNGDDDLSGLNAVRWAVLGLLMPETVLDVLAHFVVYATDKKHQKIKIIPRYQQYHAANQIVQRVLDGYPRKGLIWHFQGSGKSLLMVFAAQKLRLHPTLKNPTVLIVVDRVDLDTQITATFNAADVPNTETASTRKELQTMLARDVRKIIISTIHKFGEAGGLLNDRENIIVLVDEAHRTQEGDLGAAMREALPNAFLFGLTGTPINKRDHNTFVAFGADEDPQGYMSRYSFEESIRDEATLPLHFEARLVELRIDQEAINEAYAALTGGLSDLDRANLAKQASRMAVLIKAPERVQRVAEDIVTHFEEKIAPNGFKAQLVTFDREACIMYKAALDEFLPPEASTVVMSVQPGDDEEWRQYDRGRDEEERLLDRFRDASDPLKFLIVTAKLLTGFDAPILQAMYLDKPMKDHNLLQAITHTNRTYPGKTHGLIVDYVGIFDDVARSLDFDEEMMRRVVSNIEALKAQLPQALAICLNYFPEVDRTVAGYEGLEAAQNHLPTDEIRDEFAADYSVLSRLWETLSPDPILKQYRDDYRWLSQVFESVKPPGGQGKLLWHALGAKTLGLIHDHVHVEDVRDDLDTFVMDADFIETFIENPDIGRTQELELEITRRIRKHPNDPRFIELGKRLQELKEDLEKGLLLSIEHLKMLLEIARDLLQTEREVTTPDEQQSAKAALTELFHETRTDQTPVVVERIVNDIDEIVRVVRFPGWQDTAAGAREVRRALRRALLKYQLHKDQELFDRAYAYIEQYY
jgi:type I restriction enzyme R subunit